MPGPRNTRYFAGGQLAVFQGASEAPISESIRVERATRKNSQLAPARRGGVENGPAAALLVGYVPHHFDTGGREPDLQERKMVRDAPSSRLADDPF